jgi:peptidoglycan/LPS O-acetylase OafA/YrhL
MSATTGTPPANWVQRVNEIDLLRFVAALLVVLFHYTFRGYAASDYSQMPYPELASAAKYGYLGVPLFFLISGFVILMTASSGSVQKFVISRIVRLFPAYWVCCTATFLLILMIGGTHFSATVGQYLVNMTMMNEFIDISSIDGVYWSLAVELKFYALVAVLLLFGQIRRAQWFLIAWLVATMLLDAYPVDRLRSALVTEYAPFFVEGAMCFLVYSEGMSLLRVGVIIVAWFDSMLHSLQPIASMEHHYHTHFEPGLIALAVTVFIALMLLIATKRTGFFGKRNWVTIGALTYPLYLIHQYVGYMIFREGYPMVSRHVLLWGTIALMLLLAYAVNRLVEQKYARPLKRGLERLFAKIRKKHADSELPIAPIE